MIRLIVVGSVKEEFYRAKINFFIKEINKYKKIKLTEIKDESIPSNAGEALFKKIMDAEGEKILSHISGNDYVAALCIEGKSTDGKGISEMIAMADSMDRDVVFVIGGSLGLSSAVTKRADYKLSFSKLTFPHQLVRVMLLEQIKNAIKKSTGKT